MVDGVRYYTLRSSAGFTERGIASWYGPDFHGKLTSNRETYDMYQMTAAHKTLPLPTYLQVTNLENGRTAVLRVNDRGPFKDNRVIDLSYAAALKLDIVRQGTAFVEIRALNADERGPPIVVAQPALPQNKVATSMFLQIGAFQARSNAERLRDTVSPVLVAATVRIAESEMAGKPMYRVQVGPITDVDTADRIVTAIEGIGITEHHFVDD